MRSIEPITVWKDGQNRQATALDIFAANDNLTNSAIFCYSLSQAGEILINGTLTMTGSDYDLWQDNEYAWNWVATKLGIILISQVQTAQDPASGLIDQSPVI